MRSFEPAVVEEAAFDVREETAKRRRAVAPIRRPARLAVVDAHLFRGVHVPGGSFRRGS